MSKLDQAREDINRIDAEMARLFAQRMEAVQLVAEHKLEHGLPIRDAAREAALIERNCRYIEDDAIRESYAQFIRNTIDLSCDYQRRMMHPSGTLSVNLGARSYDIILERGALHRAKELFDLDRKCLIVTGSQMPRAYAQALAAQCRDAVIVTVPSGEEAKSFSVFESLCSTMLREGFHRSDCVIAVGGGTVGDLAGFAAASFMRGVDFYNIPTTVLSQVDSSIGGKVAINLDGVKNIVGAFRQPKGVLIDPDVLRTLPARQIANGLAESIKMAATSDAELFEYLESQPIVENIDRVIERSLRIKKFVVEHDETERGMRKLLNFGHTIGHGIESTGALLHGECVALGMLPMCSPEVRVRLISVLKKAGLPTTVSCDRDAVWAAMQHDKKFSGEGVDIVTVDTIGAGRIERVTSGQLRSRFDAAFREG